MMKLSLLLVLLGAAVHARNLDDDKIVGGAEVKPHSLPYQVSLQINGESRNYCGGSVLTQKFVMTAAHCCTRKPHQYEVAAGKHDISIEEPSEQRVGVEEIIVHPKYGTNGYANDVCLLKLSHPLEFNEYVAPVKLPAQGQEFSGKAVVSGWGTLTLGGLSPDVLQSVEMEIVPNDECREAYVGIETVTDSMICAGRGGKDHCHGDSGGPVTCDGFHCGIVSWAKGCASPYYPGVSTKTSHFIDFINEHIEE